MSDDIIIGLRLRSDGSAEVVQDVSRVHDATSRLKESTEESGRAASRTGRAVAEYAREHDQASRSLIQMNDQQRRLIRTLVSGASAWLSLRGAARLTEMHASAQVALAQIDAALASTEHAAGLTREQLVQMSQDAARATTHTADEIQRAQVRLLSYSTISGQVFPAALQAAIDQSARLGISIEQSAEIIGRAIELPSRGMTSLSRQGFQFSEEMLRQAEVLEDNGRLMEAQAMVLAVLEESYGGAAAATLRATGSYAKFKEEAGNVGTALGGVIDRMAQNFLPTLEAVTHLIGADLNRVLRDGGDEIDAFSQGILDSARRMMIGTAGIVDTLAAPLRVIKGLASDLWDGFQELGQIPGGQEVGILGLLLSGTKGRLAILGTMKFMADARTTADWWRAYRSGEIGFAEWFTTGHDAAAQRLAELRAAGAEIGEETDPILVKLFGTPEEQEQQVGEFEARMRAFFERVDSLMEERRARASSGGGFSFTPLPDVGSISGGFTDDEKDKRLAAFEKLQESLMTEEEALAESYQRRAQIVGEALAAEVISSEAAYQALARIDADFQKKRMEGEKKARDFIASQRENLAMQSIGIMQRLGRENEAFGKAALILQGAIAARKIMMEGEVAAMAALTPPPIGLGPVKGVALAATIRAQAGVSAALALAGGVMDATMGGGGGGGTAAPTFSADPLTGLPDSSAGGRAESDRTVQVIFQDSSFYGYDDYATEQIMQRIEAAVREADRVFITRGTRQAQELGVS